MGVVAFGTHTGCSVICGVLTSGATDTYSGHMDESLTRRKDFTRLLCEHGLRLFERMQVMWRIVGIRLAHSHTGKRGFIKGFRLM